MTNGIYATGATASAEIIMVITSSGTDATEGKGAKTRKALTAFNIVQVASFAQQRDGFRSDVPLAS